MINEIGSASKEQAHGIQQITIAVTSMDEVTQQNAALRPRDVTTSTGLTAIE
ncbi:hypothetical protein [Paraburkholderia sp. PGU16]|uniref:hypothetical protein n=1 Tax=Paraburkholderia TaxID=1822464 RepID=UPI0015D9F6AB|nr:hypothetical protein [Paraburkholderia sp. PGU16]BEU26225.1 hypothetical protein PBP221_63650 [Paraburkholderia sp. 22B1P]GJH32692.1 hypothetical protein CBA19CS91_08065 [Paraburkholderia hospita]